MLHPKGASRTAFWFCFMAGLQALGVRSNAQTVQLPTFRQFYTTGSASVPDRGAANLGGVNRYRSHSSSVGIPLTARFRNRSISSEAGSSNVSVRATIINLDEMDKSVLAAAARRPKKIGSEIERRAAFITRNIGRFRGAHLPTSVSGNDSRSSPSNYREFKRLLNKGDAAYAKGKKNVARIFYRNALKMAAEDDRQAVLDRMEKLR